MVWRKVRSRPGQVAIGGAYLIQRGQEGAGHEGGEYDGDVIVGQDVGLSLFPRGAWLCLLSLCEGELGVFIVAGHIPGPRRTEVGGGGERDMEDGRWSYKSWSTSRPQVHAILSSGQSWLG